MDSQSPEMEYVSSMEIDLLYVKLDSNQHGLKGLVFLIIIVVGIALIPSSFADTVYIYVSDMPQNWKPHFGNILYEAIDFWEDRYPGTYFKQITQREKSDFVVQWSSEFQGNKLGYYTPSSENEFGKPYIAITLGYMDDESVDWQDRKFNLVDPEYAKLITIHEIGHAIGLGHSNDPNDIMYPTIYDYDLWLSLNGLKTSALLEREIIIENQSDGITISDKKSCVAFFVGATWTEHGGCVAKFLSIDSGEILTISRGVDLYNSEGTFKNSGTINVLGALTNWGIFENFGTINVSGQMVIHDTIINKGTIMINNDASVVVFDEGTLDNFGTISNNDYLINYGIINNHCDGIISGNPVGYDYGLGKKPINQVSCEIIPEKITSKLESEIISTTETEIYSQSESEGGGCLIATATYGSELAPQVQQLRELRDNTLLQTDSGVFFMTGFNQIYYSFSPAIADLERENPIFKEAVKLTITPMITSLLLLNYVDIDSDAEILGYGISLIILNVGMYLVIPIFGVIIYRKHKPMCDMI